MVRHHATTPLMIMHMSAEESVSDVDGGLVEKRSHEGEPGGQLHKPPTSKCEGFGSTAQATVVREEVHEYTSVTGGAIPECARQECSTDVGHAC
jgi:hypothetical protein